MLCVVVSGLILFNPPTMKAQTRPAETTNPSPKVFCFVFLPSAQTLCYLGEKSVLEHQFNECFEIWFLYPREIKLEDTNDFSMK